ncbi:MAG TPA: metal ABC transporter substrate-binding protein [Dehalococcoidales bacterium]|nr:metal ABC transporter substrate-binding protein [Dehalococcoidales bacterium]
MRKCLALVIILTMIIPVVACNGNNSDTERPKSIVVTYSILGSLVKELVGQEAVVTVLIPNGKDPHDWEPSARDIERVNKADLIVCNGLNLEVGLEKTIQAAANRGVNIFTATDHVTLRHIEEEHEKEADAHDDSGYDPHIWTDPLTMKEAVLALSGVLTNLFGWDLSTPTADLVKRLEALSTAIADRLITIPEAERRLVTGHESMGYFASRYDFVIVGMIVPGLSTKADVTAANLAALKKTIQENNIKVIFSEIGTSAATAKKIGEETGVKVMELNTHTLPPDGSYFTYVNNLAEVIISAYK